MDPSEHRSKKARVVSIQEENITSSPQIISQSTRQQEYGIPTYYALFKYVLEKPSLQPSFFHALAGLEVTTVTRIDDQLNPLQELEHLRTFINDDKTVHVVSSLQSKDGISVSHQGKSRERVHKRFTKFVESILPDFDDLRRALLSVQYNGPMAFVCKLSNGEYVMVQVQAVSYDFWKMRGLGYVAAFYGKRMRKGKKWKDIKRMICITCRENGSAHWKGSPTVCYVDGIEITQYFLMRPPQSLDDVEQKDWFTFFNKASRMTKEDVREKISTPAVLEAFDRAKLSTLPDRVREKYAEQESEYAQYSIYTQQVFEEGKAKGRAEADFCIKAIKNMKSIGISNKKIKMFLSLSDDEFQDYMRVFHPFL
jgi:hypothetical protein